MHSSHEYDKDFHNFHVTTTNYTNPFSIITKSVMCIYIDEYYFFLQGTFASMATKQHQQLERNMFQIDPGPGLFSKIFSDVAFIYNRKHYDYPRVTQTVSLCNDK